MAKLKNNTYNKGNRLIAPGVRTHNDIRVGNRHRASFRYKSPSRLGIVQKRRSSIYPVYLPVTINNKTKIKVPPGTTVRVKGYADKMVLSQPREPSPASAKASMMTDAAVISSGFNAKGNRFSITEHIRDVRNTIHEVIDFLRPTHINSLIKIRTSYGYSRYYSRRIYISRSKAISDMKRAVSSMVTRTRWSYSFKKINLLDLYRYSISFRQILQSDKYIYIDGFFCLNSPYLYKVKKGKLVIKRRTLKKPNKYLLRICPHDGMVEAVTRYIGEPDQIGPILITKIDKYFLEQYLRKNRDETFGQMLIRLMAKRSIGVEELAEVSGISERTIERYRADDYEGRPRFEYVIALCIALHLDYETGKLFVERAGYSLKGTEMALVYRLFLQIAFQNTVKECNDLLRSCNQKPLTKL